MLVLFCMVLLHVLVIVSRNALVTLPWMVVKKLNMSTYTIDVTKLDILKNMV